MRFTVAAVTITALISASGVAHSATRTSVEDLARSANFEQTYDAEASNFSVEHSGSGARVSVEAPDDAGHAQEGDQPGTSFQVTIPDSRKPVERSGPAEIWSADGRSIVKVNPHASGVEFATAVEPDKGAAELRFDLNAPKDVRLEPGFEGQLLIVDDLNTYGAVDVVTATDSAGASLPSEVKVKGGVLTQSIDAADAAPGAVAASMKLAYTFQYHTDKSFSKSRSLLKKCFNCYFPVKGAPKKFPKKGQVLPLRYGAMNMKCKMRSETFTSTYFSFGFTALKGHAYGKGSTIGFTFRNNRTLIVSARSNSKLLKSRFVREETRAHWKKFADNLRRAR